LLHVARADAFTRGDAHADTHDNGVDVVFVHNEDGSATGQPHGGSSSCTWTALPVDPLLLANRQVAMPPQPADDPDAGLYALYCGTEYRGLAWLGPRRFATSPSAPVVEELVRRIEVLPAVVQVRPDGRGITGIPSLFWVDGYDGTPIDETLRALGLTVTVRAVLRDAVWDFGDGTAPVHATLGEAWPRRSSVRHNYADPSTGDGYTVTVRVTLDPSFAVNGGPATSLAPIVLRFTRNYVVHEVQAVRNS
jgi:hypothetical protein